MKSSYTRKTKGSGLLKRWKPAYAELHSNRILITVSEFADHLGYNRQTVHNLIAEGTLPELDGRNAHKPGKPGYWMEETLAQRFRELEAQHPDARQ